MINYDGNKIYIGNLMENTNGKSELIQEDIYLVYDDKTDRFISISDTLNDSTDFVNKKIAKEKYDCVINNYSYCYGDGRNIDGKYIDENSIIVLVNKSR